MPEDSPLWDAKTVRPKHQRLKQNCRNQRSTASKTPDLVVAFDKDENTAWSDMRQAHENGGAHGMIGQANQCSTRDINK